MNHKMFRAIPQSWLSYNYMVLDGERDVAQFNIKGWRKNGDVSILGEPGRIYRNPFARGEYLMENAQGVVARAFKSNSLRRAFTIEHDGHVRSLRAWSAFRRAFILVENDIVIGTVKPKSWFNRLVLADLPEDWPLYMNVFSIWLVLLTWKRDDGFAPSAVEPPPPL